MYKYGISYYKMENGQRVPLSGVDVRLLSPGADWANGILLIEKETSGYYECYIDENDCGYYEVWDNLGNPNGSFTGKTCTIGKLDARGLQSDCIYGNHILDGVVTGSKIANEAVSLNHLDTSFKFPLSMIQYEMQDQNNGVGDKTNNTPADPEIDIIIKHTLKNLYNDVPYVTLSNQCNCFIYILDVTKDGDNITVLLSIGQNFNAIELKYSLMAIPY